MLVAYLCVPIASVSKSGIKKEATYSEVVGIFEIFTASTALERLTSLNVAFNMLI